MSITRRQFLKSMSGMGFLYAYRFAPALETSESKIQEIPLPSDIEELACIAVDPRIDYSNWIAFGPKGKVSVFTCRTELGQGLKTVITAIVTQGLEIDAENLDVIMGDTDLCPDDGATVGSSATWYVGWGFWLACEKIRNDLVVRAAQALALPEEELFFNKGGIALKNTQTRLINAYELGKGQAVWMEINPKVSASSQKPYIDLNIPNVNAEQIVTGQLQYVGDLRVSGIRYAGLLLPPYHRRLTYLESLNTTFAETIGKVELVKISQNKIAAVARRYSTVLKALAAVDAKWSKPKRPQRLRIEEEARAGAQLEEIKEQQGDIYAGLAASDFVISETYITHYTTQAPLETDTALARLSNDGKSATVWASTQYPQKAKEIVARYLNLPETDVRVRAMSAGGAFGGKTTNPVTGEAAAIAQAVGYPVKLIYSRKDQFQRLSSFKAAVVVDLTTGVRSDGKMIARKIDIFQDAGFGTDKTYAIPNVLTKLYKAEWPFQRAISRGTSYVQNCFATESHIDMVARAVGMDPLAFRVKNVHMEAFVPLLDTCAEMIDYHNYQPGIDEGIGLAMVNHGGNQLGAVAAKVIVDRSIGKVAVRRICGAFDIGTVISRKTAEVCIRGAITWGVGYALHEKIQLNGHRALTASFMDYHIPRFSDIPNIEIEFLNNYHPEPLPRGCGEMPVVPTIGAIANAVNNAIGIRFYRTPITPSRVLRALNSA